jgi:hypothetical protein
LGNDPYRPNSPALLGASPAIRHMAVDIACHKFA